VLPPLALLVSPYGLDLVDYYRTTLLNPAFSAMVNEWQAPTIGPTTAPFFALVGLVAWLLGRHRRVLTGFEQLALLATALAGLEAQRNIVWFALTALVLMPVLLTAALGPEADRPRQVLRLNAALGAAALVVLGVLVTTTLARPASDFERPFPAEAAAVAARSDGRVLANVKYADWLLWREPGLAGRVAYDARFELLSRRQILQIYDFGVPFGGSWRTAAAGYDVLVLDRDEDRYAIQGLRAAGARVAYRGAGLVVLTR
jgi:hypothetical protein